MSLFREEHEVFRATVRQFVEKEMIPHAEAWEAAGEFPRSLRTRLGERATQYSSTCSRTMSLSIVW